MLQASLGDRSHAARGRCGKRRQARRIVETLLADCWRSLERTPVRFSVRDYREIASGDEDLLYLDPPHLNEDG